MPKELLRLQNRVDYMPFSDDGPEGSYMVEKMELTDEGYLRGRAIATNVGVFPYLLEDGSVQYELRPPEEVFHPDSVVTLKQLVMTNDHPSVKVTAENSKELSIGFTGDVRQDQYHLAPSLTITDKQAVTDVHAGKKALSCGYMLDLEMTPGNWMGVHYDAIQRNIRYNHLAIVPKGRAGDAAKMKLDSIDAVGIQKIEKSDNRRSSMKITVDGVEYDVDNADFVKLFKGQEKELGKVKLDLAEKDTELKKAKDDLSTSHAKADTLKEDNDQLKEDKEKLEKTDHSEEVAKAVKARIDLERAAEKAGVEVKEDSKDEDLKKEIILTVYPKAKEKLDAGDEAYLTARYDAVLETLEDDNSGNSAFKGDSLGDHEKEKGGSGESEKRTAKDARLEMIERNKKASERKED